MVPPYLAGVPWLRLFTILVGAATAGLFSLVSRRLVDDEGCSLVAGVLVVCWPISPLVASWPSTLHYTVAAGLSLLAVEAVFSERRLWVRLAALLHLLSALTFEIFLFAAPTMVFASLLGARLGFVPTSPGERKSGRRAIVTMLAGTVLVLAWRLAILPRVGSAQLRYEEQVLPFDSILAHLFLAPRILLWPWSAAEKGAGQLSGSSPPAGGDLLLIAGCASAIAFGLAWLWRSRSSGRSDSASIGASAWAALVPGLILTVHWVAVLSTAPGAFEDLVGLASRLNYPALFGVAPLVAGTLFALRQAASHRLPKLASSIAVALLASIVWQGSMIHGQIMAAHGDDWRISREIVGQIAESCASLAPNTLVLLDTEWPSTLLRSGRVGMSAPVVSSFLNALYDDPALLGAKVRELRVIPGHIRLLEWGEPFLWFRQGEYGPIYRARREVAPPVALDRLLVLSPGPDGRLTLVPSIEVSKTRDARLTLWSHPERCRPGRAEPSAALCHAFPELCSPRPVGREREQQADAGAGPTEPGALRLRR